LQINKVAGVRDFSVLQSVKPVVQPTQPPTHMVAGGHFPGN